MKALTQLVEERLRRDDTNYYQLHPKPVYTAILVSSTRTELTSSKLDCVQWVIDSSHRTSHRTVKRIVQETLGLWVGSVRQLPMVRKPVLLTELPALNSKTTSLTHPDLRPSSTPSMIFASTQNISPPSAKSSKASQKALQLLPTAPPLTWPKRPDSTVSCANPRASTLSTPSPSAAKPSPHTPSPARPTPTSPPAIGSVSRNRH